MHLVGDSKARTLSEYRRSMHDAVHGGGTLLDEDARVGEKNLLGEGHAGNEKLHASLLELERVQRTLRTGFVGMVGLLLGEQTVEFFKGRFRPNSSYANVVFLHQAIHPHTTLLNRNWPLLREGFPNDSPPGPDSLVQGPDPCHAN